MQALSAAYGCICLSLTYVAFTDIDMMCFSKHPSCVDESSAAFVVIYNILVSHSCTQITQHAIQSAYHCGLYLNEPWLQTLIYDYVISIQFKAVAVIDHDILASLHEPML